MPLVQRRQLFDVEHVLWKQLAKPQPRRKPGECEREHSRTQELSKTHVESALRTSATLSSTASCAQPGSAGCARCREGGGTLCESVGASRSRAHRLLRRTISSSRTVAAASVASTLAWVETCVAGDAGVRWRGESGSTCRTGTAPAKSSLRESTWHARMPVEERSEPTRRCSA